MGDEGERRDPGIWVKKLVECRPYQRMTVFVGVCGG